MPTVDVCISIAHSPSACTASSNMTMEHSPGISNIKEQSISAIAGVYVLCSSASVSVKRCLSPLITLALKSSEQSDFDCFVDEEKTKGTQKEVHEMLPPPSTNKMWVQKAVAIISKFSSMNVVERKNPLKQIPCSEIAPHIRDEIVGDKACFFRTLSKAITGTEANHYAVRVSLINFMLHPENVLASGRILCQGVVYDIDAQKAKTSHINKCKLYSETAWSTEYKVFAAASMFQVKIKVFIEYVDHHVWHTYVPLFCNETYVAPMQVMLYLYHINSNHYDLVIPVFN
uniref:OTU domain-containing protein n=1 Tax=Amphimedon queenslandica TaxID=400682 RepID=A0A1X7V5W8_AMPQE